MTFTAIFLLFSESLPFYLKSLLVLFFVLYLLGGTDDFEKKRKKKSAIWSQRVLLVMT